MKPAALARRRAAELDEAAAVVGLASHSVLGATDGELDDRDGLCGELVGWVRRLRPSVVLGHDPTAVFFGQDYFNHRDHRTAGWVLLDALAPAAALPHYFPEQGPLHQVTTVYLSGTLEPDVWVDISGSIEAKVAAVECHRSQFAGEAGWVGDVVRRRAEEEGRRAGVPFAEGFRRLGSVAEGDGRARGGRRRWCRPSSTSTWTPSSPRSRSSTTRPSPADR